jgi:hypothetical protein
VFTETRGRPAIFWQTQKAARAANPGARIPRARALPSGFRVLIDTRERYPYRFAGRDIETERVALAAGDYGVPNGPETIAVVERKTLENLVASISDGTMAFQMQRLGEVGRLQSWSRGGTPPCSSLSTFRPHSSPTGSPGCRFGTPKSRSCSPIRGSSPRSGPIGS